MNRECLEAWQTATEKLDRMLSLVKLKWEFLGDQYPMQMVVQTKTEPEQEKIPGMDDEQQMMKIIYKFDGVDVSWTPISSVEIANDLHSKIVSGFKRLCNAYAHYRYSDFLDGGAYGTEDAEQ